MGIKESGQVSLEYLVLIGIVLIFIAIASTFAFIAYYDSIYSYQMRSAALTLKEAANNAYALGPDNNLFVDIMLPPDITSARAAGNEIIFVRNVAGGSSESAIIVDANVSGNLPTTSGFNRIKVSVVDGNVVFSQ